MPYHRTPSTHGHSDTRPHMNDTPPQQRLIRRCLVRSALTVPSALNARRRHLFVSSAPPPPPAKAHLGGRVSPVLPPPSHGRPRSIPPPPLLPRADEPAGQAGPAWGCACGRPGVEGLRR